MFVNYNMSDTQQQEPDFSEIKRQAAFAKGKRMIRYLVSLTCLDMELQNSPKEKATAQKSHKYASYDEISL